MNWIKLLYPRPHFEKPGWPSWVQAIHIRAMTAAYYIAQTLALVALTFVYLLLVCPVRLVFWLNGHDALGIRLRRDQDSYLEKSTPVESLDFKRMY